MRIVVSESGEKRINLVLPTKLFLNPITAVLSCGIANRSIKENTRNVDMELTPEQMRILFKALNNAAKQLKKDNIPFVEVTSSNGNHVFISL